MLMPELTSASNHPTASWIERQQRFYATRPHAHLRYSPTSVYAAHLVDHLVNTAQLMPGSRVLEVGCGAGRFTMHLLRRVEVTLVGFDLSEALLEQLQRHLDATPGSVRARCRLESGDVYQLESLFKESEFDVVVGFFFLHHLPNLTVALHQLRRILRPGGRMLFIEPNRRNPLFALQVLCCPDMSWAEEKGMFTLGRTRIRKAFLHAGLSMPHIETFGCFPPQILDRWGWAFPVEKQIEGLSLFRPLLPFRLIQGQRLEQGDHRCSV